MSDQQALHRWEVVSQGENATTYRMRVPGGWPTRRGHATAKPAEPLWNQGRSAGWSW